MDILGGDILEIYLINAGAVFDVMRHAWRSHEIVNCQFGVSLEFGIIDRLARETLPRGLALTLPVDLTHTLHNLKQARSATYAVGLERWRHCKAYRLVGAAAIGHDKISGERVKPSLHALDRRIKRFQVYCNVCAL